MPEKQQQGKEARDKKTIKTMARGTHWLETKNQSTGTRGRGGGGQRKDNGLIKTDQQLQIQVMGASKHVDDG
jgi:hypothetical protein